METLNLQLALEAPEKDKYVPGCCSDHSITFGQMSYKDIRLTDFGSLHWNIFGRAGFEEVNASYAIDPIVFLPKPIEKPKVTTAKIPAKENPKKTVDKAEQQQKSVDGDKKVPLPPKLR
ncbi:unnamed protein product [Strongylus vulgaris]|uniref:Uncharacterized protein n=1 Tax=Strongylus vulgaris TaxID=40348 RepID=A0A3P7IS70_STRVU|nr:unnamed protein product [Strongylus vulgaris]